MKLKELAEIKKGLNFDPNLLRKEKKDDGIYVQVLLAKDFIEWHSHFILEKKLKKLGDFNPRSYLLYGDYIVYKRENEFKLYRYEASSGQTIAGDGIFIVRQTYGILKNYLDFEKNRKHFLRELSRIESEENLFALENIGQIEIGTSDILELEEANFAETIGIRKPIDINAHPINVTQKPLPADKLLKRIINGELLLDTDFQRRPDLWDFQTKSRLIESMIVDLPIPAFYFDGSNDDEWIVIDGLQRLSAMHGFVNGKFTLSEMDYLPELEGKCFNELERKHQRKIEEYEVIAYILGKDIPKSVKYKIFKTINTSALKLTSQEIRHSINPEGPSKLVKRISEFEWFKRGLIISQKDKDRMEDREIALRFIAFKRTNYSNYSPSIIDFLDAAMTDIYDIPGYNQIEIIKELESILDVAYETLGEYAFSRSLFDGTRSFPHNNIMFELLTYGLSIIPLEKRVKLKDVKMDFKRIIISHFEKQPDKFWDRENAYTKENLIKRFSDIEKLFRDFNKSIIAIPSGVPIKRRSILTRK